MMFRGPESEKLTCEAICWSFDGLPCVGWAFPGSGNSCRILGRLTSLCEYDWMKNREKMRFEEIIDYREIYCLLMQFEPRRSASSDDGSSGRSILSEIDRRRPRRTFDVARLFVLWWMFVLGHSKLCLSLWSLLLLLLGWLLLLLRFLLFPLGTGGNNWNGRIEIERSDVNCRGRSCGSWLSLLRLGLLGTGLFLGIGRFVFAGGRSDGDSSGRQNIRDCFGIRFFRSSSTRGTLNLSGIRAWIKNYNNYESVENFFKWKWKNVRKVKNSLTRGLTNAQRDRIGQMNRRIASIRLLDRGPLNVLYNRKSVVTLLLGNHVTIRILVPIRQ